MMDFLEKAKSAVGKTEGHSVGDELEIAKVYALITIAESLERLNHKLTCSMVMAERSLGSLADTDIGASVLELWSED